MSMIVEPVEHSYTQAAREKRSLEHGETRKNRDILLIVYSRIYCERRYFRAVDIFA